MRRVVQELSIKKFQIPSYKLLLLSKSLLHKANYMSFSQKKTVSETSEKKNPNEFSLEDFLRIGEKTKNVTCKTLIDPIIFFNKIFENNKKLKIKSEIISEKINGFIKKLDENIYNFTKLNDLKEVHKFCQNINLEYEQFWVKFLTHTFALNQTETIDQSFFKELSYQMTFFSDDLRAKFQPDVLKMIETKILFETEKCSYYSFRKTVPWLYKWLIFKAGYDLTLKLDYKDKTTFNFYITTEYYNFADKIFPVIRRNFQGLTLSDKIHALAVYSALYHNTETEKDLRNILKRISGSITKNIEKFSSLQLVILTQIYIRTNYNYPPFWKALERHILFKLETDFTINYLIKYLQGFARFNAGSLDLYMEIDRYIGFHSEEISVRDILEIIRIYTETNKGRQKLFSFMEMKIFELKNEFNLNEIVQFLHFYSMMNYLSPKLFAFLEAKLIENIDSLNETQILKTVDCVRIINKPSILYHSLKFKITDIIKNIESENSLICITAAFLKELNKQIWYDELLEKIKLFLRNKKSASFLLKFGGLLVQASSNEVFDEELYKIFLKQCLEMEKNFMGNEKKDIQFIYWKLALKRKLI